MRDFVSHPPVSRPGLDGTLDDRIRRYGKRFAPKAHVVFIEVLVDNGVPLAQIAGGVVVPEWADWMFDHLIMAKMDVIGIAANRAAIDENFVRAMKTSYELGDCPALEAFVRSSCPERGFAMGPA